MKGTSWCVLLLTLGSTMMWQGCGGGPAKAKSAAWTRTEERRHAGSIIVETTVNRRFTPPDMTKVKVGDAVNLLNVKSQKTVTRGGVKLGGYRRETTSGGDMSKRAEGTFGRFATTAGDGARKVLKNSKDAVRNGLENAGDAANSAWGYVTGMFSGASSPPDPMSASNEVTGSGGDSSVAAVTRGKAQVAPKRKAGASVPKAEAPRAVDPKGKASEQPMRCYDRVQLAAHPLNEEAFGAKKSKDASDPATGLWSNGKDFKPVTLKPTFAVADATSAGASKYGCFYHYNAYSLVIKWTRGEIGDKVKKVIWDDYKTQCTVHKWSLEYGNAQTHGSRFTFRYTRPLLVAFYVDKKTAHYGLLEQRLNVFHKEDNLRDAVPPKDVTALEDASENFVSHVMQETGFFVNDLQGYDCRDSVCFMSDAVISEAR